jgi:hypothetical protein
MRILTPKTYHFEFNIKSIKMNLQHKRLNEKEADGADNKMRLLANLIIDRFLNEFDGNRLSAEKDRCIIKSVGHDNNGTQ